MSDTALEDRALDALARQIIDLDHEAGRGPTSMSAALEIARAQRATLIRQAGKNGVPIPGLAKSIPSAWDPARYINELDQLVVSRIEKTRATIRKEHRAAREAARDAAGVGAAEAALEAARAEASSAATVRVNMVGSPSEDQRNIAAVRSRRASADAALSSARAARDAAEARAKQAAPAVFATAELSNDDVRELARARLRKERPWLFVDLGEAAITTAQRSHGTGGASNGGRDRLDELLDEHERRHGRAPAKTRSAPRPATVALRNAARTIARSVDAAAHSTRGTTRVAHIARCEGVLEATARSVGARLSPEARKVVARALVAAKNPKARELLASIALRGAKHGARVTRRAASPEFIAKAEKLTDEQLFKAQDQLIAVVKEALEIEEDISADDALELLALMKGAADANQAAEARAEQQTLDPEKDRDLATLDDAQLGALDSIAASLAQGQLPHDSAVRMIVAGFGVDEAQAEKLLLAAADRVEA